MTPTVLNWLLSVIVTLIAMIAALAAAWISASNGDPLPIMIRNAGIAFGGAMTLGFVVLSACHLLT